MPRRERNPIPTVFVMLALWSTSALTGCAGSEMTEILRRALATPVARSLGVPDPSSPVLVVMTYGYGCSGPGPGNGLRALAEVIRSRYPGQHVITRSWNDDDDILLTVEKFPGRIVLIGHSFGGCRSIELAEQLHRPVDSLILLDPVPCHDWAFRHAGKYFTVPAQVKSSVCYYRPASIFPVSYPILNPSAPGDNRQRRIGHAALCRDPEVQKCILDACASVGSIGTPIEQPGTTQKKG
jgi:pimeloyl-ACP methyl ester carboxylesterase